MNAAPTVVNASVRVAAGVVGALSSLMFGSGPGGLDSPALWVLAAAARRQLGQSSEESQATAAPAQLMATSQTMSAMATPAAATTNLPPGQGNETTVGAPDPTTGTVTGKLDYADPEGKALKYTLTTAARDGAVTVDSKTGTFTYTPTVAARLKAGTTTAADLDSFTVTVSDGTAANNTPVVVSVEVAPTYVTDAGTATVGTGASGVALAGNHAYVSNKGDNTVTVIDTTNNSVVKTIAVGAGPSAIAANPSGTRVYVANQTDGTVSVINTADNTIIGTPIAVGHGPTGIAVSLDGKTVYVANSTDGTVSKISTSTNKLSATVKNTGIGATAITISRDGKNVFVLNPAQNSLAYFASSSTTAKTLSNISSGTNPLSSITPAATDTAVYVTTFANTVPGAGRTYLVDTKTGAITSPIGDTGGAGMATSPDGTVLAIAGSNDTFTLYDTTTGQGIQGFSSGHTVPEEGQPVIVFSADGTHLYTTQVSNKTLRVLSVVSSAPTNGAPTVSVPSLGAPDHSNGAVSGGVSVTDANSDPTSWTLASAPGKGIVDIHDAAPGSSFGSNGIEFTYTPTAAARHTAATGTATTDTFTIAVSDGRGGVTTRDVVVVIDPTNTDPVGTLTKQNAASTSTGKATGTIKGIDADGDTVTYGGATTTKGTVTVTSTGSWTYTPTVAARHAAAATNAPAADKTDTFNLTVTDGHGGVDNIPVTVTIAPANNAPAAKSAVGKPDPVSGVAAGTITVTDKDADTLTYSATNPTQGVVVVHQDGTFTYTPTAAARTAARAKAATDKFTVTVDDGHGGVKPVSITVTVAPADTAPVPGTSAIGTPDAGTGVIKGTATATDAENDKLTFSGSANTAKGKVSVASTGAFTYTPTAAARHAAAADDASTADKTDTFAVTATDKYGATATIPVTVTVLGKDTAPSAKFTAGQPNSDTGVVTGTVTAADADKDALAFSAPAATPKGNVVVNPNGSFVYTPTSAARAAAAAPDAPAANKVDTFTVTVSDGHGASTPVAVTVTISPRANTPPAAHDDAYSTDEDIALTISREVGVLANDSDTDGDGLTASVVTSPNKGVLSLNPDGSFTYTPNANANGADSFTYQAVDGNEAASNLATVNLTITPVNDPPVATPTVGIPTPARGVVTGTLGASDPDGDTLAYTVSTTPVGGAVVVASDGSFTYTPTVSARHNAEAAGVPVHDDFIVTVSDGHGGTQDVPISVSVLPLINSAPVNPTATLGGVDPSSGRQFGSVTATDPDGDTLQYSGSTVTAKGGSVTVSADGTFSYTPTAQARHDAATTDAAATGADKDTFTVRVSDGYGGDTPLVVTVPIATANNRPTLSVTTVGQPNSTTGVVQGSLTGTDPDGDILTYEATTTSKGTFAVNSDGTFTYTPTAAARHDAADPFAASSRTDTFLATVTDGHGGADTVGVTVAIAPKNDSPSNPVVIVGQPDPSSGVVTGSVTATDADGDALKFSGPASWPRGTITVNQDGTFVYTPSASTMHAAAHNAALDPGQDIFTVTIDDGHDGITPVQVKVAVLAKNLSPTIAGFTTGPPDPTTGAVSGKVTGSDPDGDSLIFFQTGGTSKGSVTVNTDGTFTFAPSAAAAHKASAADATTADKQDTFTVTAYDGHGANASTSITVTFGPTNARPGNVTTVVSQPNPNGLVTGSVHATDSDSDPLTYSGPASTGKGAVTVNSNGTFAYTPTAMARHNAAATNAATTGADKDTFTVTINDGHGGVVTQDVMVSVGAQNTKPTVNPVYNGFADGATTGTLAVADADGDPVTVTVTSTTTNGNLTYNAANRTYTYVPTAAARNYAAGTAGNGPYYDSFTVALDDGHGGLTTSPISVEILPTGVIREVAKPDSSSTMTVTPDGRRVLTSTSTFDAATSKYRTSITVVNSETGQQIGGAVTFDGSSPTYVFNSDNTLAAVRTEAYNSQTSTYIDTFGVIDLTSSTLRNAATTLNGAYDDDLNFTADGQTALASAKSVSTGDKVSVFIILSPTATSTFTLGGDGSAYGMQLTADRSRATVLTYKLSTNRRQLSVVNAATGAVLSTTDLTAGLSDFPSVALTSNNRAVVHWVHTGQNSSTIEDFNLSTGAALGSAFTVIGYRPNYQLTSDGFQLSSDGAHAVLTTQNLDSDGTWRTRVVTLDTASGAIVGGAALVLVGANPDTAEFTKDGSRIMQANSTGLTVFSSSTGAIIANYVFGGDASPGIVVSPDHTKAYVMVNRGEDGVGQIIPVDATTGATVTGGSNTPGVPIDGWFSPDGTRFYVLSRSGSGTQKTLFVATVNTTNNSGLLTNGWFTTNETTSIYQADALFTTDHRMVLSYTGNIDGNGNGTPHIAVFDTGGNVVGTSATLNSSEPLTLAVGPGGIGVVGTSQTFNITPTQYQIAIINTGVGKITYLESTDSFYGLTMSADGTKAAYKTYYFDTHQQQYFEYVRVYDTATGSNTSVTLIPNATMYSAADGTLRASSIAQTGVRIYTI